MRNPYTIDRPLTAQDLFQGRDASFSRLADALGAGRRLLLLYGKRYAGKTSFINQLPLRLSARYTVRRYDLVSPADEAPPLWIILVGVAKALEQQQPDRAAYDAAPEAYCVQALRALVPPEEGDTYLICFDALPILALASDEKWPLALLTLHQALGDSSHLAILLAVEGHPAEVETVASRAVLPRIVLEPLSEEGTEDLLSVPVRGVLNYDFEAMRRIHRLSGGQPFFVQVFGHILFEKRIQTGWVGLPEVDQEVNQVVALGTPEFENTWGACSPAAKIVLCSFSEMTGHYGLGTVKDIANFLTRLGVQVPAGEIAAALAWLATQDIVERLGGETYQIRNELFRHWLKANKNTLETVRQVRRYRRVRVRPVAPMRRRRIDWAGMLLWIVAGMLVLLIAFAWRSRQKGLVWLIEHTPVPVVAGTGMPTVIPTALPTVPPKGVAPGRIVYVAQEKPEDKWQIYVMRSDGSDPMRLTRDTSNDTMPAWSPDGRHIAFVSDRDGNREIYAMNADGNDQVNLTQSGTEDWTPAWSFDGKRMAFASFRDGNWEIYVMDANGANVKRLTRNNTADYSPTWSPDGQRIAFVSNRDGNLEIYVMAADGSAQRRFTQDKATDEAPAWSPDGSRMAWGSYRDGNMEIYIANMDGSGQRNLTEDSTADDHGAAWSPDGRKIAFFSNHDHGWDIYTLDLETGERVNLTASPAIEQSPHWGP